MTFSPTTSIPEFTPTMLVGGFVFPESPRWHKGMLWFSDIYGRKVYTVDAKGHATEKAFLRRRPSGLGFLPDGTPIVTTMGDRQVWRLEPSGPKPYADLSPLIGVHINDMVVDGHGRAYIDKAASDPMSGDDYKPGYLVLVLPDGSPPRIVADGLMNPNGIIVTPDEKTLIVAESHANRLSAYDIASDGSLLNHRIHTRLSGLAPDGICLDAEGCIWIGTVSTGGFVRVRQDGVVTHRIRTPGRWAVAPVLGGDDGRTLFMCTAETTPFDLRLLRSTGKSIGWIETARVDVPQAGWP